MQLVCDEAGLPLLPQESLYVALHPSGIQCLVGGHAIDRIPPRLRENESLPGTATGGLNIYQGIAGTSSPPVLSPSGIVLGSFLFSISDKTAIEYVPKAYLKAYLRILKGFREGTMH